MEHNEKHDHNKQPIKSILAVFAGFVVVAVLSTATDYVLEAIGIFPQINTGYALEWWMLGIALIYRCAYTVLGGYITAALAPQKPMKHVKILAIIGTIAGFLGIFAGWNLSEHWYPIAIAVTAYPLVWYGGTLRSKRSI
jgi:hypothetical protein